MAFTDGVIPNNPKTTLVNFEYPTSDYNAAAYTALAAISVASDKFATVFQAPTTGTVTGCVFKLGTVTTGCTLDVRLETVDIFGNPSGTLAGTNTNASLVMAATDDNLVLSVTFTASVSVTQGQFLAIVVVNNATTPGNFAVRGMAGGNLKMLPYGVRQIAGVWTKQAAVMAALLNYGGTFFKQEGMMPMIGTAPTTTAFNTGTTITQVGNNFTAPAKLRVTGAWFYMGNTVPGNYSIVLYEGDLVATTILVNGYHRKITTGTHFVKFTTSYTLKPGVLYRIVLKAEDTNNISMDYMTANSTAMMNGYTGESTMRYVQFAFGSFSVNTAIIAQIGVICDAINL